MKNLQKYPKYKNSGVEWIGEIPENWEVRKLKYLIKEHSGNGFPINKQGITNESIPFLKVSDLNRDGIFIKESTNYVSEATIKAMKWNLIPINSIITAKIGEALRKNHRKITRIPSVIDNNCIALEPIGIDVKFNYYLHKIIDFDWFSNAGAVPSISVINYKNFKIAYPPKQEQEQIASYLDKKTAQIDKAIKQKENLIELLKERKHILINDTITKGLDKNVKLKDSGVEWIGEIPEHWEVRRLASLGTFLKGGGIKRDDLVETGLPAILYGDIYTKYNYHTANTENFISKETAQKSVKIFKNYILFTGSGETKEEIGKCIVYKGKSAYVGGDIIIFKQNKANSKFLSYALNNYSSIVQKMIMAKGEIIVHIYGSSLKKLKIVYPPRQEQEQIALYLDKKTVQIDKAINLQKDYIAKLKEYKTTLIDSVVTGKVRMCRWAKF